MQGVRADAQILFINRVYPPQEGATGELLAELAEELARRRRHVTVLAAGGEGLPGDSVREGVRVVRVGRASASGNQVAVWRRALGFAVGYPRFMRAVRQLKPDGGW